MNNKKGILKNILVALSLLVIMAGGFFLSACDDQYKNMSVSVDKQNITIYLGETENDTEKVVVTVKGGKNISDDVHLSFESDKISVVDSKKLQDGKTEFYIKGNSPCQSEVIVQTAENNKTTSFKVNVIQPLTGLNLKAGSLPYVIKGERTAINVNEYISFYPENTVHKNVAVSIVSNDDEGLIYIDTDDTGTYLVVDRTSDVSKVSVKIESLDRPNVAPVTLQFEVLKPILTESFVLTAEKSTNQRLYPLQEKKEASIYLAHNNERYSEEVLRLVIPKATLSAKKLVVTPVVSNPTLAVVVKSIQSENAEDIIIDTTVVAGNKVGSDCYLYYELQYEGYAKSKCTTMDYKVQILSYDLIESLYINGNPALGIEKKELYTSYVGDLGLPLIFDVYPTTVHSEYRKLYISTNDYAPDSEENKILLLNEKGELLQKDEESNCYIVNSNQKIYALAVGGNNYQNASITVESKFTNNYYSVSVPEVSKNIKTIINFDLFEGATSLKFAGLSENEENSFYFKSDVSSTQRIYFDVMPATVKVTSDSIKVGENFEIVKYSLSEQYILKNPNNETIGKRYYFDVQSKVNNKSNVSLLSIEFQNGRNLYANLYSHVYLSDEKLTLSTQSPKDSTSVGLLQFNPASSVIFKTAIKVGNSANIYINSYGSEYTVDYQYSQSLPGSENYDNFHESASGSYSSSNDIIDSTSLKAFSIISALKIGKLKVQTIVSGIRVINKTVDGIEYLRLDQNKTVLNKYFFVETYNPVKTFEASEEVISLYSYDSVGFYNKNLSEGKIYVNVNKNQIEATYQEIDCEFIQLEGFANASFDEETNCVTLKAKTTKDAVSGEYLDLYSDGYIKFKLTEFEKIHIVTVRVIIKRAEMVNGINVHNVNLEQGIYMQTGTDRVFKIDATVKNLTAHNKNLIYSFEPLDGTSSSLLTVDRWSGLITLNSLNGGKGYIVITPQDAFSGEEDAVLSENAVQVRIPILVADGKSRETAFHITNLNQITNNSNHYLLMNNDSAIQITGVFTGGLYGNVDETGSPVTITFNNSGSLFDVMNGTVEDLILQGNATSAFVAKTNLGTIKNVTVDTYSVGTNYMPSEANGGTQMTGGLVVTNHGTILYSHFYGIVNSLNTAGGIAAENDGNIAYSTVEFYQYSDNKFGMVKGNTVGAIVGKMSGGSISNCYAYTYHKNNSLVLSEGTGKLGALVGEYESGSITMTFAKTNAQVFASDKTPVHTENVGFNMTNCYIISQTFEAEEEVLSAYLVNATKQYVLGYSLLGAKPDGLSYTAYYNTNKITFTSSSLWGLVATINDGFPYLKSNVNEQLTSVSNFVMKDTDQSIVKETAEENYAILFLYEKDSMFTTTNEENSVISSWNTIPYKKLFGIANGNGIRAIVSDKDCMEVLPSGVIVKKAGNVTFTIFSKFDFTVQKQYNVKIVYAINNFNVTLDGDIVSNGSVIDVKKGHNQTMGLSFERERIAVDRVIPLRQNSYNIEFTEGNDFVTKSGLLFTIDTNKEEFVNSQGFELQLFIDEMTGEFANLIKSKFTREFTIHTYNGADKIFTDVSDIIRVQPKDVVRFNVTILTDNYDEELNTKIFDEQNNTGFNADEDYKGIFENNNIDGFRPYTKLIYGQEEDLSWTLITEKGEYKYFKIVYAFRLQIELTYLNKPFEELKLNFEISSDVISGVKTNVAVTFEAQEIERVVFTNREYSSWTKEYGYQFNQEPSSAINPGMSSLLEINVYPNYANYQYLEITSSVVNGKKLLLTVLDKTPDTENYKPNRITNFVEIDNGIRVQNNYNFDSSIGLYNILVKVPSDIEIDTVFEITVKTYDSKNNLCRPADTFSLITRPLISSKISINGEKSALLARGESAEIKVEIQSDQKLESIKVESVGDVTGVVIDKIEEIIDNDRNLKIYTTKVFVGEDTEFTNQDSPVFFVTSTVSRTVGGGVEESKSYVNVTVVDFLVEDISLHVDSENKNNLNVFLGIEKTLDFDFTMTSWSEAGVSEPEVLDAITNLRNKEDLFRRYNSYIQNDPIGSDSYYFVNYHATDLDYIEATMRYKNFLNNLYYVNSDGSAIKVLSESGYVVLNPYFSFEYSGNGKWSENEAGKYLRILGKSTGTQNMRLMFNYRTPDGKKYEMSYDFSITILVYTDEDKPTQITTSEEFNSIRNEGQVQDYILMNDIELTNYVPFDTSKIASFDGNNKVITIRSFDLANSNNQSSLSLALFTNVTEKTLLKNVTVNYYHYDNIIIDTTIYKNISISGLAVSNTGLITNCQVLAFRTNGNLPNPTGNVGLNVSYSSGNIMENITSNISGFVLRNSGTITNSRLGGETFTTVENSQISAGTYQLSLFTISGQGSIAGFVLENSGKISSSFANKIALTNNTSSGIETSTSGFVGINSGKITLSYAKGAYSSAYPGEVKTTGSAISTSSIGAGFVYTNNGTISDCYSNIKLQDKANNSGRNSAGFVYTNNGNIDKCYSSSIIENSVTTQMDFNGVDDYGNLLNNGTITNCYYYSPREVSENGQLQDMEQTYNSGVLRVESFNTNDIFYGFSFATINSLDGVWVMTTSKGPELVSANNIAISSRYVQAISETEFIMPYTEGYEYGSDLNPIIIRNAQELNQVFGTSTKSAIKAYFNMENKTIFGNYRLIDNIDLEQLSNGEEEYKLISSEMTLTNKAVVDGNSLEISNLELVSSVINTSKGYGLFAQIVDGSIVMNINIKVNTVSASNIQNVGVVTGILQDSKLANINIESLSENVLADVLGQNVVGGAVGYVFGNSSIVDINVSGLKVIVDYYNENGGLRQKYSRVEKLSDVSNSLISYAGGVVGILDIYFPEYFAESLYKMDMLTSPSQASTLHVNRGTVVKGGTAGGVIGYSGINTSVRDCQFTIDMVGNNYMSKIISYGYAAGGIIGENYGDLTQSKIEHSLQIQNLIESNLNSYYNSSTNYNHGYDELFINKNDVYNPTFVGGLIGQSFSGSITVSYSRANVIATNADYVGGLFGAIGDFYYEKETKLARNFFNELYAFGDVKSKDFDDISKTGIAAGIAGFIEFAEEPKNKELLRPDIIFAGVNAVNFFSKDHEIEPEPTSGENYQFVNIYDFYGATFAENRIILADEYRGTAIFTIGDETTDDGSNIDVNAAKNYVISNFKLSEKTISPKRSVYAYFDEITDEITNEIIPAQSKTIAGKIESFNSIVSPSIDGGYMDVIFRNNNWSPYNWERKTNELLPRIIYTTVTTIFYIRVAEDLKLMEKYPDRTFIIIGTGMNNGSEVLVDCSSVDDDFFGTQINSFRGVLKGYMPNKNDVFYPADGSPLFGLKNLKISKALFKSTSNGAIFSDFILQNCGMDEYDMIGSSILVEEANGTIYKNIKIRNCSMSTTNSNAGILAGNSINSVFEKITVEHTVQKNIVNISINDQDAGVTTYNAGLFVGKAGGSRKTSIINPFINIGFSSGNYGVTATVYNSSLSGSNQYNKKVNIGGFVGYSEKGQLELSTDIGQFISLGKNNEEDIKTDAFFAVHFIQNNNCKSNYEVNTGIIAGQTNGFSMLNGEKGGSVFGKIIIENGLMINTLNVGGMVGKDVGAVTINSINKDDSKINIDMDIDTSQNNLDEKEINLGGVIGYAAGSVLINNFKVHYKDNNVFVKNSKYSHIHIISNKSNDYIGGVIGSTSGTVDIQNCQLGTQIIYGNVSISAEDKANLIYGGYVGYVRNQAPNESLDTNNELFRLISNYSEGTLSVKNKLNVYAGGAFGAFNSLSKSENNSSVIISENVIGDIVEVERIANCKLILGGIIGSIALIRDGNSSIRKTNIVDNFAVGDFNIILSSMSTSDLLKLGGIIAECSGSVKINNNISLTTMFSTRAQASYANYFASAIAADGDYLNEGGDNYYCSDVNLLNEAEARAINLPFLDGENDIASIIKNNKVLKSLKDAVSEPNGSKLYPYQIENYEDFYKGNSFVKSGTGSKADNNNKSRIYMVLVNNIENATSLDEPLNSGEMVDNEIKKYFGIIGNGKTILINNQTASFISYIDDKSFISGLRIIIDKCDFPTLYDFKYVKDIVGGQITAEYKDIYAPISVNQGVIFGVNVVGNAVVDSANLSSEGSANIDSVAKMYVNASLASGFVAINQGLIISSYDNIYLSNIKKYKIYNALGSEEEIIYSLNAPRVAGFVAVNQGDIVSSYSMGRVGGIYSEVYSFSYDETNPSYVERNEDGTIKKVDGQNKLLEKLCGSVSNSWTATNCTDSLNVKLINNESEKICSIYDNLDDKADFVVKTNSYVFGVGASNTCFYDIYATGVEDRINDGNNRPQKFITSQMNNLFELNAYSPNETKDSKIKLENNLNHTIILTEEDKEEESGFNGISGWTFDSTQNYGYPVVSSLKDKPYNKVNSISCGYYLIPNIGLLQSISYTKDGSLQKNSANNTDFNSFMLIDNMSITEDMGCVNTSKFRKVGFDIEENTTTDLSNWENFSINKLIIDGNMHNVSGIKMIEKPSSNYGIFSEIKGSNIKNIFFTSGIVSATTEVKNHKYNENVLIPVDNLSVSILAEIIDEVDEQKSIIENVNISGFNVALKNVTKFGVLASNINNSSVTDVSLANTIVSTSEITTNEALENGQFIAGLATYSYKSSLSNCEIANYLSIKLADVRDSKYSAVLCQSTDSAIENIIHSGYILFEKPNEEDVVNFATGYFEGESDFSLNGSNINAGVVENSGKTSGITRKNIYIQPEDLESVKPSRGDGEIDKPYIISTKSELNYCLLSNKSFVMENQIDISFRSTIYSIRNDFDIYGQNNILQYKHNASSLISNKTNKKIINISNLSLYNITYQSIDNSFIDVNNGDLVNINSFGLCNNRDLDIFYDSNVGVSGLTKENNGNIICCNNYKILIGTSGNDGAKANSEEGDVNGQSGENGFDANLLGGLVCENFGNIFSSNNGGAIVGGNGGNGSDGLDGKNGNNAGAGKAATLAGNGGKGGHGGNASIIGGLCAKSISENTKDIKYVTGGNVSPIICGNAGDGGNGGAGGNGGNAWQEIYMPQDIFNPSMYLALFKIKESINRYNINLSQVATSGAGGGAGGNGGAALAGDLIGLSSLIEYINYNNPDLVNRIIISNENQGYGGQGGQGGRGGKGILQLSLVNYMWRFGGAGGGAGGNGYNGNSNKNLEAILGKVNKTDSNQTQYFASSGKSGDEVKKDGNVVKGGEGGKGSSADGNSEMNFESGTDFTPGNFFNNLTVAFGSLTVANGTFIAAGITPSKIDDLIALPSFITECKIFLSVVTASVTTCNYKNILTYDQIIDEGMYSVGFGGNQMPVAEKCDIQKSTACAGYVLIERKQDSEGITYFAINNYEQLFSLAMNLKSDDDLTKIYAGLTEDLEISNNIKLPIKLKGIDSLDKNGILQKRKITLSEFSGSKILFTLASDNEYAKIENIDFVVNATNPSGQSSISSFVTEKIENLVNCIVSGTVKSNQTIENYVLDFKLTKEQEANITQLESSIWTFEQMEFKDGEGNVQGNGSDENPYLIDTSNEFDIFVQYANKGSKKHYKLSGNVSLNTEKYFLNVENDEKYVIGDFYGTLSGKKENSDECYILDIQSYSIQIEDKTYQQNLNFFICNNLGTLKDLNIIGDVIKYGIACNNGSQINSDALIENVKVSSNIGTAFVINENPQEVSGFVYNNYGKINNSIFAGNIDNYGGAFGFAVYNYNLISSCSTETNKKGNIISAKNGQATGFVKENSHLIVEEEVVSTGMISACKNAIKVETQTINDNFDENGNAIVETSPRNGFDCAGFAIVNIGTIQNCENSADIAASNGFTSNFDPNNYTYESLNEKNEIEVITYEGSLLAGTGGRAAGIVIENYFNIDCIKYVLNEESEQVLSPNYSKPEIEGQIVTCKNTGKIISGQGGTNIFIGGLGGNGGDVGDITCAFELEDIDGVSEPIYVYGKISGNVGDNYNNWGKHGEGVTVTAGMGGADQNGNGKGDNGRKFIVEKDGETKLKIAIYVA